MKPANSRLRWLLAFACPLVMWTASISAQEADTPKAEAEETPDPFAVAEDASSEELVLMMRRLMRMQPAERTPDAILDHFTKVSGAANEILKHDLNEEAMLMAVELKFGVLTLLDRFGQEDAAKQRETFLKKTMEDERPAVALAARKLGIVSQLQTILQLSKEDRQKLIDEVANFVQQGEFGREQLAMAMQTARGLEVADAAQAAAAYNLFAKYAETAQDEQIKAYAAVMQGSARRLDLPGKPIEISGTTVGGEKFDISQYKGKVVLVDFWATWCGPCIGELPNVLANYEKYHAKGFEVVGISLDENAEALTSFIEERQIPWVTLYQEGQGFENNNARYYGVSAIPTAILVNQEGNVVSLRARGEELTKHLEDLLGPVEEASADGQ